MRTVFNHTIFNDNGLQLLKMFIISNNIKISENEIKLEAIRSQGPGGQNVNKVSSAIHLRFDIVHSSLPKHIKEDLLRQNDKRISKEGVIIIKAQRFRTQEKNREDAMERLKALILKATIKPKKRKPTKVSKAKKKNRMDKKKKHGQLKKLRQKVSFND